MNPQISEMNPELSAMARRIPQFTFNAKNRWLIQFLTRYLRRAPKIPNNLIIENVFIPGQDPKSQIRLRIYRPRFPNVLTPVLLWLHGGGYIIGNPEMDDALCMQYANEVGIVIVSVDYRLAPKDPFPSGLDDSFIALKWICAHAKQLSIDANCIAIGGESAGAGLAAALVQLVHDQSDIKPVFQLLVYPMLDDRTCIRTDIVNRRYLAWDFASNRFGWEAYLRKYSALSELPNYAVPARREDLSGLPPTWIGVGSLDLFHDEDIAYAQRLKECGVDCEIVVVAGAFHGFDIMAPQAQLSLDFRKSQMVTLKRYLFPVKSTI